MKPAQVGRHLLGMALLMAGACSRIKAPVPPPAPPPLVAETNPTVFSIAATNVLVDATNLPTDGKTPIVRADFNNDRREDVAVAEKDPQGQSVVSIYLRSSDARREDYFKAGGIRQAGDYSISALMSATQQGHTDLLVIFKYPDGRKEMVHFRSDGGAFQEVMREPIAGTAPTEPASPK